MFSLLATLLGLAAWILPKLFPDKAQKTKEEINTFVPDAVRRQEDRKNEEEKLGL